MPPPDARGDLWVGLWNGGRLMKIDYETDKMTLYAPPGMYSVSVEKKNNLVWVSEQQVDKIILDSVPRPESGWNSLSLTQTEGR
jgi:streptogramin lyase